ncbi:MAG TPA: hypothetical protein VGQ89_12425 [Candidatus Limnocylindrales bacterium]|nr:hypothetical protein [Candidatus Limnocylindrales bacterium]
MVPGQGVTPGGSGVANGPALGELPVGAELVVGVTEIELDVGWPPDGSDVNPQPARTGRRIARRRAANRLRASDLVEFTAAL